MCGRFTLTQPVKVIAKLFELDELPEEFEPRYNVAPSQLVAVVGLKPGGERRGLVRMRWGFVPRWANGPNDGPKPINAKAETVATNAAFRQSFKDRRCLIPTDGFYEWDRLSSTAKQPYLFRPRGEPAAFAGIWDVWRGGAEPLYTCAIITTDANEVVGRFHDRMPAILTKDQFAPWLAATTSADKLLSLLRPLPAADLEAIAVSTRVNSARNEGPECLERAVE